MRRWRARATLAAELGHQRVGNLEVRIDVLHIVVVFERIDEAENFLTCFVIDRDHILRFPDEADFARLAEFRFEVCATSRIASSVVVT